MKDNFVFTERDRKLAFVGDFNSLYTAKPDPWDQSGTGGEMAAYYAHSRAKLARALAQRYNDKACGLEVGCGYGYLTELLSKKFRMAGVDISPIAIKRAEILHPGIPFDVGDVRDPDFFPGTFHFVVLAQCWWYILSDLDEVLTVLNNCLRCLEPNGMLVVQQGFLKDGEQKYGCEIAEGFNGALFLLTSIPDLQLVECHYDDTGTRCLNDGLLLLRKVETEE